MIVAGGIAFLIGRLGLRVFIRMTLLLGHLVHLLRAMLCGLLTANGVILRSFLFFTNHPSFRVSPRETVLDMLQYFGMNKIL
ncbi:hypothetical protein [Paenibacillus glycanilyticus]|uniref:hypothetical protein n=1 Tax=Paenibacillus glycanilyticus TaxID=126569 RepID=UPI0019103866|nr:hypothetical protein [Paenibacillus glycanilyticus]